jgi:hypothetical protein
MTVGKSLIFSVSLFVGSRYELLHEHVGYKKCQGQPLPIVPGLIQAHTGPLSFGAPGSMRAREMPQDIGGGKWLTERFEGR